MSGDSSSSVRVPKVKCKCGNDAVFRTVKNGANVGTKFYGCPMWPVMQFNFIFFKIILVGAF